jgi:hypothetical protein
MFKTALLSILASLLLALPANAQGTGPVASQCAKEIQAFCADRGHGNRQTRSCLEAKRSDLSQECRQALDSTGPARGKVQGKGQGPVQ